MRYGRLLRPVRWVVGCAALAALAFAGWVGHAADGGAGAGNDQTSINADLGHNPVWP